MALRLSEYDFDQGLDRIYHGDSLGVALPAAVHLPPSGATPRAGIERVLALPNLQDFLATALRPEVENKALLTPHGFDRALRDCLPSIRRRAAEGPPDQGAALKRAARILSEEADLRDLLHSYRNALLQG